MHFKSLKQSLDAIVNWINIILPQLEAKDFEKKQSQWSGDFFNRLLHDEAELNSGNIQSFSEEVL